MLDALDIDAGKLKERKYPEGREAKRFLSAFSSARKPCVMLNGVLDRVMFGNPFEQHAPWRLSTPSAPGDSGRAEGPFTCPEVRILSPNSAIKTPTSVTPGKSCPRPSASR